MANDTLSRMTESQAPNVLALLARAGGTARTPETWAHDHMTALLLGTPARHETPTAAMPLSQRTLSLAPGTGAHRTLRAGWISSNQFAARMGLRRQTRATAGQWADLLPELDALVVVRRDQPSLVARWYAQTGFHAVLGIRCLYLEMDEPPVGPTGRYTMQVAGLDDLATPPGHAWGQEMVAVHHAVFGNYGGPLARDHPAFWQDHLRHHFYHQHYQFQIIGLWDAPAGPTGEGTLMGYAVVGWSGWHSKRPRMDILELATRQWDTTVAEELLRTTCQLAWSKDVREVRAVISVHDPYRSYLTRTGFADRWGYVMLAKWLHPQRYLDHLAHTPAVAETLGDLTVQINAPGLVSLQLGRPAAAGRMLRLEGDAGAITRLLLQRLEISAAVREGTLLALDANETDLARLALTLPWTPWVFHMVDYI